MKTKVLSILTKLAAKPQASFIRFLFGFTIFLAGLLPLLYSPYIPWLNWLCLGLLFIGGLIAATGYIGILADRILRFYQM